MKEKEILKKCPICRNPIKPTEANFTTDKIYYCIKCNQCKVIYHITWDSTYELKYRYKPLSQEDIKRIRKDLIEHFKKTGNAIIITTRFLGKFNLEEKPKYRPL